MKDSLKIMENSLEMFQKYIESDEGKKSIEKYSQQIKFREELKDNNIKRLKSMFTDQKSFNLLVNNIINKHDDEWRERCYNNGVEPHPWELLYTLFDLATKEGHTIETPLDNFTKYFPSYICSYKKWKFAITHGQGSVCSVYYNNKLKYRN